MNRFSFPPRSLDQKRVLDQTCSMQVLTVSKAKAQFSRITRDVIRRQKPVVVRTPHGLVQIVPYELPEVIEPAPPGSLHRTDAEIALGNTFGESL